MNRRAILTALGLAIAVALLYVAFAERSQITHQGSVLLTAVVVFATILGTAYTVLRDTIGIRNQRIRPLSEFGWPFTRVVALGTAVLVVISMIGSLIGGILLLELISRNLLDSTAVQSGLVVGFINDIFTAAGCYFIGRWVGYKCIDKGLLAILLIIVVFRLAMIVLGLSVFGFQQFGDVISQLGTTVSEWLTFHLFLVILAFGGFWLGSRARGYQYLHYLVKALPPDSRDALLELAYEESVRLRSAGKSMATS